MIDDVLLISGLVLFVVLMCFGVTILQANEGVYCVLLLGMVACMMAVAFRAGEKKRR